MGIYARFHAHCDVCSYDSGYSSDREKDLATILVKAGWVWASDYKWLCPGCTKKREEVSSDPTNKP